MKSADYSRKLELELTEQRDVAMKTRDDLRFELERTTCSLSNASGWGDELQRQRDEALAKAKESSLRYARTHKETERLSGVVSKLTAKINRLNVKLAEADSIKKPVLKRESYAGANAANKASRAKTRKRV